MSFSITATQKELLQGFPEPYSDDDSDSDSDLDNIYDSDSDSDSDDDNVLQKHLNYHTSHLIPKSLQLSNHLPEPIKLNNIIQSDARNLLENNIIRNMSVIDWGKAMARCNEIIQKDLLNYFGITAYDPEIDIDCPKIDTANNSPGFDIIAEKKDGTLVRIQSKLRQVGGVNDYSRQVHFETTRRHSKKNENVAAESGHVAYGCDEFDYVLVSLINVGKCGKIRINRNNVDNWSFALVPIIELIDKKKQCCVTHIPAKILQKYKFDPRNPVLF